MRKEVKIIAVFLCVIMMLVPVVFAAGDISTCTHGSRFPTEFIDWGYSESKLIAGDSTYCTGYGIYRVYRCWVCGGYYYDLIDDQRPKHTWFTNSLGYMECSECGYVSVN